MRHHQAPIVQTLVLGCALTLGVVATASAQIASSPPIYDPSQLTVAPAIASQEEATRIVQRSYPRILKTRGIGGSVMIRLVVQPDGTVDESTIEVVAATIRRLGDAAREAVKEFRFTPGRIDGREVPVRIEFTLEYRDD